MSTLKKNEKKISIDKFLLISMILLIGINIFLIIQVFMLKKEIRHLYNIHDMGKISGYEERYRSLGCTPEL